MPHARQVLSSTSALFLRIAGVDPLASSTSRRFLSKFDSSQLRIQRGREDQMGEKPPVDKLVFGKTMTDHMLTCKWSETEGWGKPLIEPVR